MKAILVLEMPSSCDECDVMCGQYYSAVKNKNFNNNMKPDNCPLREVPQKKKLDGDVSTTQKMSEELVRVGYNACIDEILGDKE